MPGWRHGPFWTLSKALRHHPRGTFALQDMDKLRQETAHRHQRIHQHRHLHRQEDGWNVDLRETLAQLGHLTTGRPDVWRLDQMGLLVAMHQQQHFRAEMCTMV